MRRRAVPTATPDFGTHSAAVRRSSWAPVTVIHCAHGVDGMNGVDLIRRNCERLTALDRGHHDESIKISKREMVGLNLHADNERGAGLPH